MNKIINAFAVAVLMPLSLLTAFAGEQESGVRGGGEVVNIDGSPVLRDLVDRPCQWKRAHEVFGAITATPKVLGALAEVHWYLAGAIEREARNLKVCFTGKLVKISGEDLDKVTVAPAMEFEQAAIRLNNMIFIDETIFGKIKNPAGRTHLMVHEIGHSFIPMGVERRNDKVRSFARMVSDNYAARVSRDDVAINLEMNDVAIMQDTGSLDQLRTEVNTLLNVGSTDRARMLALSKVGMGAVNAMWPGDQELVAAVANPYYETARQAVFGGEMKMLLKAIGAGVDVGLPFFEGKSLIQLAAEVGNSRMVTVLLGQPETASNASTADELLLGVLTGKLKTVSLDRLMQLQPNPNRFVTLEYFSRDGQLAATVFTASVILGRYDVTEALAKSLDLLEATSREAARHLVLARSHKTNAILLNLIDAEKIDLNEELSCGTLTSLAVQFDNQPLVAALLDRGAPARGLLAQAAGAGNVQIVDYLLSRPGVDVNEQDANGFTPFDSAVRSRNVVAAARLASHPSFQYRFKPTGDAVATHENAKWILEQFSELNQPAAVLGLLQAHRFGWFDLFPRAELAKMRGQKELEAVIRKEMEKR